MFKRQIAIYLVSFFISSHAFSNDKIFPGYIINLKGDTIHCKIEFNDRNIYPKSIQIVVNNSTEEFSPRDIKGFGVEGYGDYISTLVTYHTNPVSGKDIPRYYSDSTVTQYSFLKILDGGPYSLYDLVLPERVYFFTAARDSSISELIYRVKNVNDTLISDDVYKKQIFKLFTREGIEAEYINQINRAYYDATDLKSLFKSLNEKNTGIRYKKKSSGDFQIQVFAGAIRNSFSSSDVYENMHPVQFQPSYSLSGGVNFLYSIPGHFKAFKIGLSFGYNGYKNKTISSGTKDFKESDAFYWTSTYNDTLTASNSLLVANLYFMYVLNPLSKIKMYLKAGAGYNFSLSNNIDVNGQGTISNVGFKNGTVPINNVLTNSGVVTELKKKFPSFLAAIGLTSGRSTLEFSYLPNTQLADPGNEISSPSGQDLRLSSISVYYYFSLFPVK
jgi:hypothetical protein